MKVEIENGGHVYGVLWERGPNVDFKLDGRYVTSAYWYPGPGFMLVPGRFAHIADELEDKMRSARMNESEILESCGSSERAKHDAAINILIHTTKAVARCGYPPFTGREMDLALAYLRRSHKYT
ncbi:hypothetical protein LCGC14_0674210 [marine sediment metagenome]|uniref:Uncharacterized protein n=1 Tax=marine sediment metagenome TaxID=412755 RepID=A0A0F9QV65_9ZZZZ